MDRDTSIITDSYWTMLKSLRDDVKLSLATRLSASVADKPEDEKTYTLRMLNRFHGAWKDSRSADEITRMIKENGTSKSPVEL